MNRTTVITESLVLSTLVVKSLSQITQNEDVSHINSKSQTLDSTLSPTIGDNGPTKNSNDGNL